MLLLLLLWASASARLGEKGCTWTQELDEQPYEGTYLMQRGAQVMDGSALLGPVPLPGAASQPGGDGLGNGTSEVNASAAAAAAAKERNASAADNSVKEVASEAAEAAAKAALGAGAGKSEAKRMAVKAAETVASSVPPEGRWESWRNMFRWRQRERHRTALSCSILPMATAVVVAAVSLMLLRGHVMRNEAPQATRSVYLVVNFVLVLNYTIVILDSYDLCATLGLSKSDSGRMVGTYMLGFCGGAFCSWLAVRKRPQLWRESSRGIILVGLSCQLVGSVAYSFVALKATDAAGKVADMPLVGLAKVLFGLGDRPWLAHLLMASRLVSGVGSGTCQQFYVSSMLHLTPVAERSEHTSRWVFSGMLAIGLGPLAAASLQALDLCGRWPRFELVGHVQVLVVLLALFVVIALHPSLANVEDHLEPSQNAEGANGNGGHPLCAFAGRRALVCGCLVMTGLRAFGVSAIEVAIALRLEESFLWDQRVTGLAIGGIFLCCIPLKAVHAMLGKSMTVVGWIRVLCCLSIFGSALLFNPACRLFRILGHHTSCAYMLITAGVVLFPCFYLSDALGSGLMHQHVLPEGSLLDANHAQLWYNLFQGLGRFLGPWLARFSLQTGGQDTFAAEQLAVTCAFLVGFETFVRPFIAPKVLGRCEREAAPDTMRVTKDREQAS